ncbi:uncharacterized protein DS421_18g626830 [Arachis hypogaea]|nr:uncharacterized protein DS421_18g626830 [Arachis hypogaea]
MARQGGNDGDINRLNETLHYARAADFDVSFVLFFQSKYVAMVKRSRLLLPRRVSHTLPPPDAIVPYLAEAGFGNTVPLKDFTFDNSLISALVELTCTRKPRWGCLRDFGRWYHTETWALVEQLLGARPLVEPQQAAQRKESFTLKLVWIRNCVCQMPPTDDPDTLRQYARCYIMLLIGGYLMTDKSNNLVHLRWLPLLRDFGECRAFS